MSYYKYFKTHYKKSFEFCSDLFVTPTIGRVNFPDSLAINNFLAITPQPTIPTFNIFKLPIYPNCA